MERRTYSSRLDYLKHQLSIADSDAQALSISTQIMREERHQRFVDRWLFKFQAIYNIKMDEEKCRYTIEKFETWGTVDFYPKSNKVLIRVINKWKQPGLQWLIKNSKIAP